MSWLCSGAVRAATSALESCATIALAVPLATTGSGELTVTVNSDGPSGVTVT